MEYRRFASPDRLHKVLVLVALIAFGAGNALSAGHGHGDEVLPAPNGQESPERPPSDFGPGDLDCVLCHGPKGEGALLEPVQASAAGDVPIAFTHYSVRLHPRDAAAQSRARAPPTA